MPISYRRAELNLIGNTFFSMRYYYYNRPRIDLHAQFVKY